MSYTVNTRNTFENRSTGRRMEFLDFKKAQWAFTDKATYASSEELVRLVRDIIDGVQGEFHKPTVAITKVLSAWAESIPPSTDIKGVGRVEGGIDGEVLSQIRKLYKFGCNSESIMRFILINNMADFLVEASEIIRRKFGNEVDVELSIEGTDIAEEPFLYARVYTNLSVDEALKKVDEIDSEWLIDNLDRVQGRFNFDVEWK